MRAFMLGLVLLGVASPVWASETITYSYDDHGRLITVLHQGSVNNNQQAQYQYDKADNRTQVQVVNASH